VVLVVEALLPAFLIGILFTVLLGAAAFFTAAFFATGFLTAFAAGLATAAFLATVFFTGFLGMTRTLIRMPQVYQLRHGQSFM
jgi:predicted phage tail protein